MDLGKLKVTFDGDTTKLETAQRTVSRVLRSVNRSMVSAGKAAAKYGSILAGVGVGITTVFVKSQLESIDALAKTSDALGITTEKLQALQHAGELNGITTEEVNKALARMERRLGEVSRIGGTAAFAFRDIGVNIDEIVKLSPDQQFEALSAALVGVENQAVKASIANDIFGRSGLKALKLMEQLQREGLEPTVKELDELGFSINRIEAAKVEAANDAMLRFRKGIQGVFQSLTVELAPILEAISNEFIQLIKDSGGADKVMKDLVRSAVKGFGFVADAVALVSGAVRKLANAIGFVLNKIKIALNATGELVGLGENVVGRTSDKISEYLVEGELPSTKFDRFYERITEKSQKAAEEVAKNLQNKNITGDFESSFFKDQEQKKINTGGPSDDGFERFRESLLSEEQLEIESYQKRLEQLQKFIENKKLTEDEAMLARETIQRQHEDALTNIQAGALQERMSMISSTMQTQVSNIADSLKFITGVAGKEGKKQFEISKIASIATALVKGGEAVISSYAAGAKIGGPIVGAAFAATAAGAVGAQIQSIRSQQYGGGSGGGVAAGGGGGVASQGQQAQAQGPQRSVRIQGINPNDIFSGEQVKSLIEKINDEVNDGATLISTSFAQ